MPQLQANVSSVDLTNCDREPIHVPGRVQSHGLLLALDEPGLIVRHASDNALNLIGVPADAIVGKPLSEVLGESCAAEIDARLKAESIEANPSYAATVTPPFCGNAETPGKTLGAFHAVVHRFKGKIFLELEPALSDEDVSFHNLYSLVRAATGRLKGASSVADLCQIMAEEFRRITGFDRIMVYQFDPDWHGTVVAEERAPDWHSYMDLRFPGSDIPRQARQLYLLNRLRLIADVDSKPADLIPRTDPSGNSVDLSYAVLRSVSPIHIEYLKNMGVGASMSVSVVQDDTLWGLIACHHRAARQLPYEVRAACEHLGEIMALQLSAKRYAEGADYRIALRAIQSKLLARMAARDNFVDGLVEHPEELLGIAAAEGCAVYFDGVLQLVGKTPGQSEVDDLLDYLRTNQSKSDVFHTDSLSTRFPQAERFKETASGILALSVPRFRDSHVVWFRPEMIQTVNWAGDPNKPVEQKTGDPQRLHPRKSFEIWKETVLGRSRPWRIEEVSAVAELREAIVGIILRKAEELARVNTELVRTNKELEAFSYSVSHDLRAPFRHISGFCDLLQKRAANDLDDTAKRYIHTIMESARHAGTLVDSLLAFSQMSRTALKLREIDMTTLVNEVRDDLHSESAGRNVEWHVSSLPTVVGDVMLLKLAVRNLLSNALKYSRTRDKSVIDVRARDEADHHVFSVKDNGVGFDMRYKDKLFGVFQRLHRPEEFEGTGIGLANVRRTIERLGGRTWAESGPDQGATFYFTLPKSTKESKDPKEPA